MNVLIIEGFSRNLGIPAGVEQDARQGKVELWNAARPFPCHETYHGEFVHGIFYGVIYPDQDYADEYRERAVRLDAHRVAHRVEFVSKETVWDYARKVAEEYGIDDETVAGWKYKDIIHSYVSMRRRQDEESRQ